MSVDSTQQYYEERAADYARANALVHGSLTGLLTRTQRYLPDTPPHASIRALDWGCGHGRDMQMLLDQGYVVSGLDRSRALLEIAHGSLPNPVFGSNGGVQDEDRQTLYQSDLTTIADEELIGSQNLIWSIASFCHLPRADALTALGVANTMLADDGILTISTKEGEGESESWNSAGDARLFYTYYHADEFANLLGLAGFILCEQRVTELPNGQRWLETVARIHRRAQ